jgi:hypothetical protein
MCFIKCDIDHLIVLYALLYVLCMHGHIVQMYFEINLKLVKYKPKYEMSNNLLSTKACWSIQFFKCLDLFHIRCVIIVISNVASFLP